jgi:hypothetical protein
MAQLVLLDANLSESVLPLPLRLERFPGSSHVRLTGRTLPLELTISGPTAVQQKATTSVCAVIPLLDDEL